MQEEKPVLRDGTANALSTSEDFHQMAVTTTDVDSSRSKASRLSSFRAYSKPNRVSNTVVETHVPNTAATCPLPSLRLSSRRQMLNRHSSSASCQFSSSVVVLTSQGGVPLTTKNLIASSKKQGQVSQHNKQKSLDDILAAPKVRERKYGSTMSCGLPSRHQRPQPVIIQGSSSVSCQYPRFGTSKRTGIENISEQDLVEPILRRRTKKGERAHNEFEKMFRQLHHDRRQADYDRREAMRIKTDWDQAGSMTAFCQLVSRMDRGRLERDDVVHGITRQRSSESPRSIVVHECEHQS